MVLDDGRIHVFRVFDRIGDDPNHLRFIKLPESTRYVEERAAMSESTETIIFIDTVTYKRVEFNLRDTQIKMNKILKAYAKHLDVPVKDLSFDAPFKQLLTITKYAQQGYIHIFYWKTNIGGVSTRQNIHARS